ncbi:MAG: transporter substrate-binding domain-containing protein [Tannerella sp.]|jgi:membrane-bound lytic murein transglycosylase F|nr:transporter substrate-binding domain-containing protein [Tannerella sp.]
MHETGIKRTVVYVLLITLSACNLSGKKDPERMAVDLPQLREKKEITVVTLNASTSYFIYKMQQMGYEYDLIEDFAGSQGLALNIKVAENITRLEEMLQSGEADLVAYPVQMDHTMKNKYLFCGVEQQNHLVIVQRANKGDTVLSDVTQLIGKEVWVKKESRYHERLKSLNEELGGGIIIRNIERDTVTTEDLIEMVSLGEIRYTVSENNLARLNRTYYRNIHIGMPVSFPQRASWIVRKDSPELAQAVNEWAEKVSKSPTLKAAVKRYFEQSKNEDLPAEGLIIKKGDISPYDDLFKKYAEDLGWEWQLLASIACQESRFHNHLESWAGARGLMGVMPRTARSMGFIPDSLDNPETAIRAGVKCLISFRDYFSNIKDPEEKIKFTLAAYNAGNGHITDARRLASKHGGNPDIWEGNVAEYIRLKSEPEYYNDPVCKHGYLRGAETFGYVSEVLSRYRLYKSRSG